MTGKIRKHHKATPCYSSYRLLLFAGGLVQMLLLTD